MKSFLPAIFLGLLLVGCQSKEDKVEALIKDNMFKTLYDYDSYQPIETKIDSAFYSAITDSTIHVYAYRLKFAMDEVKKATEELEDYLRTIKIYSDSYSSYGRMEYDEAMEKANECSQRGDNYLEIAETQKDSILAIYERHNKKQFIGWKATHKFRCKTKGGSSSIGNYMYLFDKDMSRIVLTIDNEDETFTDMKKYIEDVLEDSPSE